ncbi:MAG: hypothetical protein JXP34_20105 [Planctomycetes bacterium]|nr:hypothetical protein [Planctomycetota bacterium]
MIAAIVISFAFASAPASPTSPFECLRGIAYGLAGVRSFSGEFVSTVTVPGNAVDRYEGTYTFHLPTGHKYCQFTLSRDGKAILRRRCAWKDGIGKDEVDDLSSVVLTGTTTLKPPSVFGVSHMPGTHPLFPMDLPLSQLLSQSEPYDGLVPSSASQTAAIRFPKGKEDASLLFVFDLGMYDGTPVIARARTFVRESFPHKPERLSPQSMVPFGKGYFFLRGDILIEDHVRAGGMLLPSKWIYTSPVSSPGYRVEIRFSRLAVNEEPDHAYDFPWRAGTRIWDSFTSTRETAGAAGIQGEVICQRDLDRLLLQSNLMPPAQEERDPTDDWEPRPFACASAALYCVTRIRGAPVSLDHVNQLLDITASSPNPPVSLDSLCKAARHLGLDPHPCRVSASALACKRRAPAIAHVTRPNGRDHYIVVLECSADGHSIRILDAPYLATQMPRDTLETIWDGVMLLFDATDAEEAVSVSSAPARTLCVFFAFAGLALAACGAVGLLRRRTVHGARATAGEK